MSCNHHKYPQCISTDYTEQNVSVKLVVAWQTPEHKTERALGTYKVDVFALWIPQRKEILVKKQQLYIIESVHAGKV